jgi:hypothetical protein
VAELARYGAEIANIESRFIRITETDDDALIRQNVKQLIEILNAMLLVSAIPSGGTELGETLKQDGLENLTAMQEVVKRLSQVGSLEEALRIQMAFVHSQLNVWGRQATHLAIIHQSSRRRCKGARWRKEVLIWIKDRASHGWSYSHKLGRPRVTGGSYGR